MAWRRRRSQGCCLARDSRWRVRAVLEPPFHLAWVAFSFLVLPRACGQLHGWSTGMFHAGSVVCAGPGLFLEDGLAGRLVHVDVLQRAVRLLAWAHLGGFRRQIPFPGGPLCVELLECLTVGCRLWARNRVSAAGRKQIGARAGQGPAKRDWTCPLECPPLSSVEERFLQSQDTPWANHVNRGGKKNIQCCSPVPKNLSARLQGEADHDGRAPGHGHSVPLVYGQFGQHRLDHGRAARPVRAPPVRARQSGPELSTVSSTRMSPRRAHSASPLLKHRCSRILSARLRGFR